MINEQTCDILRKMKLNAMANELLHQLNDPNQCHLVKLQG